MPDTAPASPAPSTLLGPDGRQRCAWVGDTAELRVYHDDEWGVPVRGDHALFERIALEGFQSGLSWLTILRRREGFRRAFAGFGDPYFNSRQALAAKSEPAAATQVAQADGLAVRGLPLRRRRRVRPLPMPTP